jgi:hypothetical protein
VNKYLYIEQYSIPTAGGQPRLVKRQRYEIVFDIKVPQTVIIKSGTTGELVYNGSVLNDTAESNVVIGASEIWNVSRFNEPFIRMGDAPVGDRFTSRGLPSVRELRVVEWREDTPLGLKKIRNAPLPIIVTSTIRLNTLDVYRGSRFRQVVDFEDRVNFARDVFLPGASTIFIDGVLLSTLLGLPT